MIYRYKKIFKASLPNIENHRDEYDYGFKTGGKGGLRIQKKEGGKLI